MTIFASYVMSENNWYKEDDNTFFIPDPRYSHASNAMIAIYAFQLGIWTYSSIRHRFFEARRADYYMMFTHHLTTISLELLSFSYGTRGYGVFIMLVFIFIYLYFVYIDLCLIDT